MAKPSKSAKAITPVKRESPVQLRLPEETIQQLDKIAKENNIPRSAVIAIACSKLIKSGI